ncbi:MAG TPA: right-handed parallel beta-helix repeat-containing protein, partial [Longimicrobiales bacterium]|nr:right-handed parallel beta-helix repeat-containing protein [Longimicrobiales bacterium]
RSLFVSSANDAIDLMGSSPLIRGNQMLKSGDKGVSIGESSSPIVSDNLVEDGNIGMEIKDRSEPVLIRNRLVGNRIGLSAYAKNWRYAAGGFPRLIGGVVSDNAVPLQFDGKSRLTRPVAQAEELAEIVELGTRVIEQDFSGGFWDGRREWLGLPGTEVDTNRWDLVVRGRGRSGGALSRIDWNLTDPEVTYHLLLEYRVSPETDGVFRVLGETGSQEIGLPSPVDSLSDYRWEMITLPPDRYGLLEIEVEPPQGGLEIDSSTGLGSLRSGQVRIHRFSVYTTPGPGR